MKLRRLDVYATEDDYFGSSTVRLERDECPTGDYIKVEDLKEYLNWHFRNRTTHTIYSDLDRELE